MRTPLRSTIDEFKADGGTRTASISGACVALVDAINHMRAKNIITTNPLKHMIAAVSVGVVNGEAVADLEYTEDSVAETDMNVVMTESGKAHQYRHCRRANHLALTNSMKCWVWLKTVYTKIFTAQKSALNQ